MTLKKYYQAVFNKNNNKDFNTDSLTATLKKPKQTQNPNPLSLL